jgi:site-specific recombinase XerD
MNDLTLVTPVARISPLRQRLIDDMKMRRFSHETRRNYIRDVARFATFLERPPDTATAEDVRRFQIEQQEAGVPIPTMNSIVAASVLLHAHAGSSGARSQGGPNVACPQGARGAQPR